MTNVGKAAKRWFIPKVVKMRMVYYLFPKIIVDIQLNKGYIDIWLNHEWTYSGYIYKYIQIHTDTYRYIQIDTYTYIHTYIPYHYITLHCIALHYIHTYVHTLQSQWLAILFYPAIPVYIYIYTGENCIAHLQKMEKYVKQQHTSGHMHKSMNQ